MIKSVVHLNDRRGYIIHYKTPKGREYTVSYCENKVPETVRKFMENDNVEKIICENSLFYKTK